MGRSGGGLYVPITGTGALTTTLLHSTKVTGDAYNRYELYADGTVKFGDGTYAPVVAADGIDQWRRTNTEEPISIGQLSTTSFGLTSGRLYLNYWRAKSARQVTTAIFPTGNTVAAATPTVCRMGLYTVDTNGDGTLVASTANDTTLFTVANSKTSGTKALSANYTFIPGQLYAMGLIVVSGATMPSFYAQGNLPPTAYDAPRRIGMITSLSDLPLSFLASAQAVSSGQPALYGQFT